MFSVTATLTLLLEASGLPDAAFKELPDRVAIKVGGNVLAGSLDDIHLDVYARFVGSKAGITDHHKARAYVMANRDKLLQELPFESGFVTTKGRFVTREEAYQLMPHDLRDKLGKRDWLDSADLYYLFGDGEDDDSWDSGASPLEDPNAHPHYKGRQGD